MDKFTEKVLPFLEKHVQWLALGLGAVFLALMAYSYVIQRPVTVPVGGQQLVPSQVDAAVAESPDMVRLKRELGATEVPNPKTVPAVPQASEQFVNAYLTPVQIPPLPPPGKPPAIDQTTIVKGPNGPPVVPGVPTAVPQFGPATYLASSVGRGIYTWVPLAPLPAGVVTPPGGEAVEGGDGAVPPANLAVTPTAPVRPPQPAVSPLTDWTSHTFEVSLSAMDAAFKAAGIDVNDPIVSKTAFVAVELYRQEKMPGGSWSGSVRVPPLPGYQPVMKELPKPTATRDEKIAYTQWAAQYVPLVVQPAFPTMVKGDAWVVPGTPPSAVVIPGIAGAEGAEGVEPPPPPEAVEAAGAEGGGGGVVLAANVTPGLPGSPIPGAGTPEGVFNPAALLQPAFLAGQPDVKAQILCHDLTVASGKTYRYMIRYHVRNPLWLVGGLAPALSDPFAVAAKESAWSKEVSTTPRVEFFAKAVKPKIGNRPHDEVEFDMFFDRGGQWAPSTMTFAAGDQIGGRDGNSGWSVVDVRRDTRVRGAPKYYVIVADQAGQTERRDVAGDQGKDRLRKLRPPPPPPAGAGEGVMREGGTNM